MGLSDMSHGGYKCSDMGHIHFLNLTCDTVENKRQSHATLPFLETDMRHWDPHQGPQVWVHGIVNRCGLVGGGGEFSILTTVSRYLMQRDISWYDTGTNQRPYIIETMHSYTLPM